MTITGGEAAGSGAESQEGPEMSYICGGTSATRQDAGQQPADLHRQGGPRGLAGVAGGARVVPDLYRPTLRRRLADTAAVAVLFIPLYVLALIMDRDDRRSGVTR